MYRHRWFPSARLRDLRLIVLVAAVAACIAACGGTSSGPGASSAAPSATRSNHLNQVSSQGRDAFVQCMRSHGLPNFPSDFGTKGAIEAAGIDVHSATYQSAVRSCASYLR